MDIYDCWKFESEGIKKPPPAKRQQGFNYLIYFTLSPHGTPPSTFRTTTTTLTTSATLRSRFEMIEESECIFCKGKILFYVLFVQAIAKND
jgi:hypothetical protein